jgi:hypothetical protein
MRPQPEVPARNFFAPLNTEMEVQGSEEETNEGEQQGTNQAGRPPPIILSSATNLLQLQKQIKGIVKRSFEFRNTKNGTRVLTKEMADFSAIKFFLSKKKTILLQLFPEIPETYLASAIKHACGRNLRSAGGTWS